MKCNCSIMQYVYRAVFNASYIFLYYIHFRGWCCSRIPGSASLPLEHTALAWVDPGARKISKAVVGDQKTLSRAQVLLCLIWIYLVSFGKSFGILIWRQIDFISDRRSITLTFHGHWADGHGPALTPIHSATELQLHNHLGTDCKLYDDTASALCPNKCCKSEGT